MLSAASTSRAARAPLTPARPALGLLLTLAAFLSCGVLYGLATPPFEMPDEPSHLMLVRYLQRHATLPPMNIGPRLDRSAKVAAALTYHDPPIYYAPPLYYGLAALITAPIDMADLPHLLVPNPRWELDWALTLDTSLEEKNFYAHRFGEETWEHSGTVRALYLLRGFSLGLGVVTLLAIFQAAQLLWPHRPCVALGAVAIVAFTPQFIATSAAVTNDTLTNALFAIFFLRGLALVQRPTDRGPLELGAIAGLASLTKQSGLMLLPLGVLMVCSQHSTLSARAHWRRVAVGVASFLATATLVGGWWYARNAILYGDALGLSPHFGTQVPLRGLRLRDLLQIADSYYATFGWALIRVEQTVYRLARVVALVAAAGVAWSFWPGQGFWSFPGPVRRSLAILATALLLNVALLIRWAVATGAPLGRLLYPSALPIALLAAWGYAQWARWRVGRAACWGVALLAVAFAFVVPWRYLRPAFRSPLVERLPAQARTLDVAFDNGVSVAGYTADPPLGSTLSPGETIHLTLFWSVGRDLGEHYRAWVQLGPRDAYPPVVVVDTWAGGTLYPSGLWRAGDLVRQDFELPIPAGLTEPCLLWVRGGLVKGETRVPLSVPEERQPPPPPESWDTRWQALLLGPYRLVSGTAPEAPCALGGLLAHVRLRHQ